jgi:hypothetical protein
LNEKFTDTRNRLMNALKEPVLKILNKIYEPSSMVEVQFKRYDLAFKTDEEGRPILLFMGEKDAAGRIQGERYARRLVFDAEGKAVKDHWDHKGKATAQL